MVELIQKKRCAEELLSRRGTGYICWHNGKVVHPLHSYPACKLPLPKFISTTVWMPSASFWAQALTAAQNLTLADHGPWKRKEKDNVWWVFFRSFWRRNTDKSKALCDWFFFTIYLKGSGSELKHFCCGGNVWDVGCKPVATNIPAALGILEWSGRQPRESGQYYLHQRKTSSMRFKE